MTAGFRYIKPGGTTAQIDNEYSNLVLREKKTFVVPLGAEWYIGTTTISGSQDSVIAFSADQFCGLLGSSQSGQTWTLVFAGRVNAPAPTVTIYSFDVAGYGQQYEFANAALEIWKPDRTKAFSSRLKYLRPIDTLSEVVPPTQPMTPATRIYGGSVLPAVVIGNLFYSNFYQLTSPGPQPDFMWIQIWSSVRMGSGGRLDVDQSTRITGPHRSGTSFVPEPDQPAWTYTVLDVSGL